MRRWLKSTCHSNLTIVLNSLLLRNGNTLLYVPGKFLVKQRSLFVSKFYRIIPLISIVYIYMLPKPFFVIDQTGSCWYFCATTIYSFSF